MENLEIDLIRCSGDYLRNVQVDNVIFGYYNKEIKVLLQKANPVSRWTITGGYVKRTESIQESANRIAFLRTGLDNLFLQQFSCFGSVDRSKDIEKNAANLSMLAGVEVSEDLWIFDRFVSIAFYTLTDFSKVELKRWSQDSKCEWWPVATLPTLMFDHEQIIFEALRMLRMHISFFPIGYELLSEKFTLPEIHSLYETILGRELDQRNFQRKLLASGIVEKLSEIKYIGPHRGPNLYRFNKISYDQGLKNGILLSFL